LRQNDVLVVTSLARLAGGLRDLIGRMHEVQSKGASVRALQGSIDTCTASGSQLLATLLSFDRQVAGDRIQHGMRAARSQGQHVGRPRLLTPQTVQLAAARLRAGEPVPQIARSIGVSPQTLRRAFQAQELATDLNRESHP
jgi:DNA invertase Pin-like site-specific DNA recombinase